MIPEIWCLRKGEQVIKFYIGDTYCQCCGAKLEYKVYVVIDYNRIAKNIDMMILCLKCFQNKPFKQNMTLSQQWHECFICESVDLLSRNAYPLDISFHGLTEARAVTTFDAASQKVAPAVKVFDRTVHAGRESWSGAAIGQVEIKELEDQDVDQLIEDLR